MADLRSNLRGAAYAILANAQPANNAADSVTVHRSLIGELKQALDSSGETPVALPPVLCECQARDPQYVSDCREVNREFCRVAVKTSRDPSPRYTCAFSGCPGQHLSTWQTCGNDTRVQS